MLRVFHEKFYNARKNDSFVLLKEDPNFKMAIYQFQLPFLKQLGLKKSFQYGMELEFKEAPLDELQASILDWKQKKKSIPTEDWIITKDDSVTEEESDFLGGEAISPIYHDTKEDWLEVAEMCEMIKALNGYISWDCGFHVHVDFEKLRLTKNQVWNLLLIWYLYEDVLYGFAKGEVSCIRGSAIDFANSIRPFLNRWFSNSSQSECFFHPENPQDRIGKRYGLNLENYQKKLLHQEFLLPTIEFRIGNGTLSPNVIQNYLRLYSNLLKKIQTLKGKYDLEKTIHTSEHVIHVEVNLERACEFADFVFDNNFDKMCFLKQYVKVK